MKSLATPWFTVPQVAENLSVHQKTVRYWVNKGLGGKKLKAHRAAGTGRMRITEEDLKKFLAPGQN